MCKNGIMYFEVVKTLPSEVSVCTEEAARYNETTEVSYVGEALTASLQCRSESLKVSTMSSENRSQSSECILPKRCSAVGYVTKIRRYF